MSSRTGLRALTVKEMDRVYSLPYTRASHPDYDAAGGVRLKRYVSASRATEGASGSAPSVR